MHLERDAVGDGDPDVPGVENKFRTAYGWRTVKRGIHITDTQVKSFAIVSSSRPRGIRISHLELSIALIVFPNRLGDPPGSPPGS